jgi:flagellar assembly factor FliW
MRIDTKAYGSIDVDERQRITFPAGILGFENLTEYVLLDSDQPPFFWLQSLQVVEIAFVLINPVIFRPDYQVQVPQEELDEIRIQSRDDMLVFAIVTIPENQNNMTANLQGPIVINRRNSLGRQCISGDPRWKVRHNVMAELAAVRNEAC